MGNSVSQCVLLQATFNTAIHSVIILSVHLFFVDIRNKRPILLRVTVCSLLPYPAAFQGSVFLLFGVPAGGAYLLTAGAGFDTFSQVFLDAKDSDVD